MRAVRPVLGHHSERRGRRKGDKGEGEIRKERHCYEKP